MKPQHQSYLPANAHLRKAPSFPAQVALDELVRRLGWSPSRVVRGGSLLEAFRSMPPASVVLLPIPGWRRVFAQGLYPCYSKDDEQGH
jgi:hypothetical protein